MARPRQYSDQQILQAARACFLEHGTAVSTQVIADTIGLSQAALFKRFGTKERLMVEALSPPAEPPWVPLLEEGPDDRPLREQLEEVFLQLISFFAEIAPCLSTLRTSGIDVKELMDRYEVPPPLRGLQALKAWLERVQDKGLAGEFDPEVAATTMVGALHGRIFLAHISGEPLDPDRIRLVLPKLVDLFAHALNAKEPA